MVFHMFHVSTPLFMWVLTGTPQFSVVLRVFHHVNEYLMLRRGRRVPQ